MFRSVGGSADWSELLPGILNVSWFVLVLSPTLLYISANWGPEPVREFASLIYIGCCLPYSFVAFGWLVLFLLAIALRRVKLRWWLWLQAIVLLGSAMFAIYSISGFDA